VVVHTAPAGEPDPSAYLLQGRALARVGDGLPDHPENLFLPFGHVKN
jgi:hypothetical protein